MPSGDQQPARSEQMLFTMRMTASERSAMRAAADQRGTTVSDLVRQGLRAQGIPMQQR